MEVETLNTDANNTASSKRESKRSASYPSIPLLQAYEFTQKINEKFSIAEVTRDEISYAFGVSPTGPIIRDIASSVQFGLLDKNTVEGKYKLTQLFIDIFRPENDRDRKLRLIQAFGSPKLYQELIAKFDNNVIPEELVNTLIKHHGITVVASNLAAKIFIESAKQVGVLTDNRILKYQVTISTVSKTQYAVIETVPKEEVADVSSQGDQTSQSESADNGLPALLEGNDEGWKDLVKVPIYLTKSKIAWFGYPKMITANDIRIVKHQLEGIMLRIELEEQEEREKQKGAETPS